MVIKSLKIIIALTLSFLLELIKGLDTSSLLMNQLTARTYTTNIESKINAFANRVEFRSRPNGLEYENVVDGTTIGVVDLQEEVTHISTINPDPINDKSQKLNAFVATTKHVYRLELTPQAGELDYSATKEILGSIPNPNFVVGIRGTSRLVASSSLQSEKNIYRLDFLNATETSSINLNYEGVVTSLDTISRTTMVITTSSLSSKIFFSDASTLFMLYRIYSPRIPTLNYARYIDYSISSNLVLASGKQDLVAFDYFSRDEIFGINMANIATQIQFLIPVNGTKFAAVVYVPHPEPSSFKAQNRMKLVDLDAALISPKDITTIVHVSPVYFPDGFDGLSITSIASSEWSGSLRWIQSDGKYVDLVSETNFYCRIGCDPVGCTTKLSPVGCQV